jgi:NADH-quinone oxidoreductase subunit E
MAARTIAPPEKQPASFAFSAENEEWIAGQIAKYPEGRQASTVIALLWKAQEQAGGWLPIKAIEAVAARLSMPNIRVMEIATFYTMFNLSPVGKYFVQLCGTTPCALRGAERLKKILKEKVGEAGEVSADGNLSWIEVECLGACSNAPMAQINNDYYEDLSPENFTSLLDNLVAGRPVKTGSQSGRTSAEPEGNPSSLTDETLFDGSRLGEWRKRFDSAPVVEATPSAPEAPKASEAEPQKADAADASAKSPGTRKRGPVRQNIKE